MLLNNAGSKYFLKRVVILMEFLLHLMVIPIPKIEMKRAVLEVGKRKTPTVLRCLQERLFQLLFCLSLFGLCFTEPLIRLVSREVLWLSACQLSLSRELCFSFERLSLVDLFDLDIGSLFLVLNRIILIGFFEFVKQLFLDYGHFRIVI